MAELEIIETADQTGEASPRVWAGRPRYKARGSASRRLQVLSLGLAASDVVSFLAALVLTRLGSGLPLDTPTFLLLIAIGAVVCVTVFQGFSLYRIQHLTGWEEFRRILAATSIVILLFAITDELLNGWLASPSLGFILGLALFFELLSRRLWRWRFKLLKREGLLSLRTVVVGINSEAQQLADSLSRRLSGFAPVGFISTGVADPREGLPVLGSVDDVEEKLRDHGIECAFIASSAVSVSEMMLVTRACRRANIQMRVSATVPDVVTSRLTIHRVEGIMTLAVKPARLTGSSAAVKRLFELAVASVALVAALPLLAGIALAVMITSGRPVLFRQDRVTRGGRAFTIYKFRTMVNDAMKVLEAQGIDPSSPFFKLEHDPRITAIGRLLRRFSLDELPQLWNVIRGDMSLVGPRPLPLEQVVGNLAVLGPRHEVRPGLTGWWQVNGRSDLDDHEALRMDLFYIENWSLAMDLYILLKTMGVVLTGKGAR